MCFYQHSYVVAKQPMCAVTVPYIPALSYCVLLFLPFPAQLFTYRQLYFKLSLTDKILELKFLVGGGAGSVSSSHLVYIVQHFMN